MEATSNSESKSAQATSGSQEVVAAEAKTMATLENDDGSCSPVEEPPASPARGAAPAAQTLSKNQLKKKRRWEKKMEIKKRRKLQDREVKAAKAAAQGRDIEQERKQQEAARLAAKESNRTNDKWEREKLPLLEKSFQVCVDCAFEASMTPKEINSLATQLRFCYSVNRRNPHPCRLAATSVSGTTLEHLQKVSGFEEWSKRAFTVTSESLEVFYPNNQRQPEQPTRSDDEPNPGTSTQLNNNILYLTSDSETVLQDLDDTKIYVIGGIVDRNRLRRAALDRANELGVTTARLPIDEHMQMGEATRVLTVNTVFELLLKYREHGRDWKKALLEVLPHRKDAKVLEDDDKQEKKKEETVEGSSVKSS